MNKMTLLLNAWRAWRHARNQEGSSLRGLITGSASVLAVIAITFYRGDLSPADVGVIAAAITGLDAVLKYAIPDRLHQDPADAPTGPEPKSEPTEPPPAPCPQCGAETEVYLVFCDGHVIPIHRCRAHGDVVPAQEGV